MNVQATSSPSATATATAAARNDVPPASESGSFAEVLGRRLETGSRAAPKDAAPAIRTVHTRRPQEPGEREALEAGALPLITAALESRVAASAPVVPGAAGGAAAAGRAAAPAARGGPALAPDTGHAPTGTRPDTAPAPAHSLALPGGEAETPDAAAPLQPQRPLQPHADAQAARATEGEAAARALRDTAAPETVPVTPAVRRGAAGANAAQAAVGAVPQQQLPEKSSAGALPARPAEPSTLRADTSLAARAFTLSAAATDDEAAARALAGSDAPAVPGAGAAPAASFTSAAAAPAELALAGKGYVEPPVGSRAWPAALGQELTRMQHTGQGQAQLELNPPGLGPLSVTLSVADQQAQALFVSPHPAVRAALEAALPQLRTALADSGITLGQASVGAEHQPASGGSSQAPQDQSGQRRPASADRAPEEPLPAAAARPAGGRSSGGHAVDTFA